MATEFTDIVTVEYILVTGRPINNMVYDCIPGVMVNVTKGNTSLTKDRVMALINGQMEGNTQDLGKMESNME